ncbi:multidrug ABC transporter permease/ATP-binding protein, partial [Streptococcus danieliae]|nr:multidrug ABC transporter permease/ATP-binding protein [Streptococcus danieliae]
MYLFKKLRWFLKEEKKEYIIAIASLIIVSILNLVPPIIIGNVIDAVNDKNLSKEDLLWNVGLLLLSALSMYYLRYIWRLNLFGAA